MSYGVRHSYGDKDEQHGNRHEYRKVSSGHGYSVQSSVLQSSGAPEEVPRDRKPITRFNSEGDSGDYRIGTDNASEDMPKPFRQPAGYDLNGVGGEKIASPPNMLARGFRQEKVLMSHEGYKTKGSDYDHPGERGFKYRARHDGV